MCQLCNDVPGKMDLHGHVQGCPMSPDVSDWADGALLVVERHYVEHLAALTNHVEITTPDMALHLDTPQADNCWHANDLFHAQELWRWEDGEWIVWFGTDGVPLLFYIIL